MKKIMLVALAAILGFQIQVKADEGMWLPMFVKRLNHADMQKLGLKLTADEIYSVNNSSLKDAIVRLGGGFCTGEMISSQGLMLTNHHCGYGSIQSASTVENDYLTNGFWAMKKEQEIPAGFSVSFLQRMDDVSAIINAKLNEQQTEDERNAIIAQLSDSIEKANETNTYIEAVVKSFFKGNEFYLFVYKTYPDVRLVGAPPSSIGKFGGDTDNWMWPRHTGDFTLFRVYANADNEPSEYSTDNKPYMPKHHLPISLKGVNDKDYAMIFGYPGSTDRFLTSYGVQLAIEKDQPSRVKIRRQKLDIYEESMNTSDEIRIKYASKHASVSNYWKYFIGQTQGLKRLKVYDKKKAQEDAFVSWVNQSADRKEKYGSVITLYQEAYNQLNELELAQTYLFEAIFGIEILKLGIGYTKLYNQLLDYEKAVKEKSDNANALKEKLDKTIEAYKANALKYFKNYHQPIDKKVFEQMIEVYNTDLPINLKPQGFNEIMAKNKNNYAKYTETVFSKSVLSDMSKLMAFLENPSSKVLAKDPAVTLTGIMYNYYTNDLVTMLKPAYDKKDKADRLFVDGLRKMNPNKVYADDANSTMRVTYGQVLDYYPQDAVYYSYYTTANGILEKEDPTNDEFIVPEKLKTLIKNKDFGKYANEKGELVVCFLSNNDITGGNSGSPVINGNGELIGTAFDGNWEAMSGDIAFEPNFQRTISVDIRYTLFIIDKYAGAGHLIDEMTLVTTSKSSPLPVAPAMPEKPVKPNVLTK